MVYAVLPATGCVVATGKGIKCLTACRSNCIIGSITIGRRCENRALANFAVQMTKLIRLLIAVALLAVLVYGGYRLGRQAGRSEAQTQLIENYSFVKDIAELASLEVNGVSTFKSTNLANDGSWSDALRKAFIENTVQLSVPYTAKYGVDLQDSTLRLLRKDSVVEIHLPQPRLLSFELRIDRMEAAGEKGWLLGARDDRYLPFQKKLYEQTRAQLAANAIYLGSSRERVCKLLNAYFRSLHLQSSCIFEPAAGAVDIIKN